MSAIPEIRSSSVVNNSSNSSGSLLDNRVVKVALAVFVSIAAFALLPPPIAFVISAISLYLACRSSGNDAPLPNDNYYVPSQNYSNVRVVYRERTPQPVILLRHPSTTYYYDLPPEDTTVFRRRHTPSHQPPVYVDTTNRINETPSAPVVHMPLASAQPQRQALSETQRTSGYNLNPPSQEARQPSVHSAVGSASAGRHSESSFAAVRNAASALSRTAGSTQSSLPQPPANLSQRHAGVGTRRT